MQIRQKSCHLFQDVYSAEQSTKITEDLCDICRIATQFPAKQFQPRNWYAMFFPRWRYFPPLLLGCFPCRLRPYVTPSTTLTIAGNEWVMSLRCAPRGYFFDDRLSNVQSLLINRLRLMILHFQMHFHWTNQNVDGLNMLVKKFVLAWSCDNFKIYSDI